MTFIASLTFAASTAAAVPSALCPAAAHRIDTIAAATLADGSPGMIVMVAKGDQLLFTGTYGFADLEQRARVRPDTVFSLASITKQFTAAIVMTLVSERKLTLADPVTKFVPELPAARDVTIEDLLQQTSGIPDFAEDPGLDVFKSRAMTPEEKLAWIVRLTPKLAFDPGTKWAYSNSNYALLGLIAERITGAPLSKLFEMKVASKLPSTTLTFDDPHDVVPHRAHGYRKAKAAPGRFENADWISPTIPGAAGGLRGTALDLVKWQAALFGGRILTPTTLARMTSPGHLRDGRTTRYGMPIDWQEGLKSDYAMGLFVKHDTPGGLRIGHQGDVDGFSGWSAHYPKQNITIVQLINSQSADLHVDAVEEAAFAGLKTGGCGGRPKSG